MALLVVQKWKNSTSNRSEIRDQTRQELEETIRPYNMGISIVDVNFQVARPPEAVKAAFDDVIAAREEEQNNPSS